MHLFLVTGLRTKVGFIFNYLDKSTDIIESCLMAFILFGKMSLKTKPPKEYCFQGFNIICKKFMEECLISFAYKLAFSIPHRDDIYFQRPTGFPVFVFPELRVPENRR